MNEGWSQIAANAVANAAERVAVAATEAAYGYMDPSVMFRPALSIDGNQWCALYGENLQDGVAGFGDSPSLAMHDFNLNWSRSIAATEQAGQSREKGMSDATLVTKTNKRIY